MLAELFMLRLEAIARVNARMTSGTNNTPFVPIGAPRQNSNIGSTAATTASSRQTAMD
jgi:hypothetical protein